MDTVKKHLSVFFGTPINKSWQMSIRSCSVRPNVDFDLLVSAEAELVLAEGHFTFVRMSELLQYTRLIFDLRFWRKPNQFWPKVILPSSEGRNFGRTLVLLLITEVIVYGQQTQASSKLILFLRIALKNFAAALRCLIISINIKCQQIRSFLCLQHSSIHTYTQCTYWQYCIVLVLFCHRA